MEEQSPEKKEEAAEKAPETEEVVKRRLVGVQFSKAGKVHSFSAEEFDLSPCDLIVVEGDKGPIIGRIVGPVFEKNAKEVATNIRKVLRKAEAADIERHHQNREEAMKAFKMCQNKIVEHKLSMKLVDVDVLTGDAKAIFYFTAEERVDFRSLVKDLATNLHKRIEMRQIGARDAAKGIGSFSSCGLVCCCENHMREFKSIAIQMAKNQGLSPNPTKLTGMCGKLKCCLLYENEMYSEFKRDLPDIGSEVETPKGSGIINSLDIPRQLVYVYIREQDKEIRFPSSEVKVTKKRARPKRVRTDDAKKEKKARQ